MRVDRTGNGPRDKDTPGHRSKENGLRRVLAHSVTTCPAPHIAVTEMARNSNNLLELRRVFRDIDQNNDRKYYNNFQ